jgi:hypothetical protein
MAPPGVAIPIFLRIAASIIFLIWFPLALLYVFSTNVDLCVISQC